MPEDCTETFWHSSGSNWVIFGISSHERRHHSLQRGSREAHKGRKITCKTWVGARARPADAENLPSINELFITVTGAVKHAVASMAFSPSSLEAGTGATSGVLGRGPLRRTSACFRGRRPISPPPRSGSALTAPQNGSTGPWTYLSGQPGRKATWGAVIKHAGSLCSAEAKGGGPGCCAV